MGERSLDCDVIVLGGGPGGSTASAFLAKRGRSVIVLEKDAHPRFHIGESLLPMNMPILERLGVMDKVAAMGVPKLGADFSLSGDEEYKTYYFANSFGDSPASAFEVMRSEFDEMLFRHATASGVDTREGVRVTNVEWDEPGAGSNGASFRPVTVKAIGADKAAVTLRARYLIDATGRDTFLGKKLGWKKRSREHASAAIFSHWKGVERRPAEEQGNISIYWFDHGWMWFIPLKNDVMSIGCVCHPDYLKSRSGTREHILEETLALAPSAVARMSNATRIAEVRATGNYSYKCDRMTGPGFLMVGDAFAFLDPVFSSGVYLAMNSAERAAEVVDAILTEPKREGELQRTFERDVRRGIGTFSWFIYRFTSPGLRWIFKHPRNVYRMQDAVTSLLAGDVFGNRDVENRFRVLKLLYAFRSFAELGSYARNYLQRRRNTRSTFDKGTLAVDRDA